MMHNPHLLWRCGTAFYGRGMLSDYRGHGWWKLESEGSVHLLSDGVWRLMLLDVA